MSLQNRRLKTSAGSSSIIVLLCKHKTHNLTNFYKKFKCVPLRKDIPTLTLSQGFHLLWLGFTPLEALRFKHSPSNSTHPGENLKCRKVYFVLFLSASFANMQKSKTLTRPTLHAKQGKSVRQNSETDSPSQFKGDFKQINLVSLWVCQCSTSPYNRPKGVPVTNKQRCFNILGLQHIHWHSRHGSGSTSLGKNWVVTEAAESKPPTFCPHCGIRGFTLRTMCVLSTEKHWSKICCSNWCVPERPSSRTIERSSQVSKTETHACGEV